MSIPTVAEYASPWYLLVTLATNQNSMDYVVPTQRKSPAYI